mmetsp:Transcript_28004/g.41802  ORF Transcript_28004/g.41802 Transcript_28004/m.41802 type:complete len:146 (+) Transcript_28004:152-589(+)
MCPDLEDGNGDEEERVEYGIRRARRDVAWEYRDSSSLSALEVLEQDVYFNFAVRMTEHSMLFLHTITFLFGYIRIVNALIDSWSVCGDIMTRAISHGRRVITRCKETIHRLHYYLVVEVAHCAIHWWQNACEDCLPRVTATEGGI